MKRTSSEIPYVILKQPHSAAFSFLFRRLQEKMRQTSSPFFRFGLFQSAACDRVLCRQKKTDRDICILVCLLGTVISV